MRILYLEDDNKLASIITKFLSRHFKVDYINVIEDISPLMKLYTYDAAIIDRNLYGVDIGLNAISILKKYNDSISIIVTSSYSSIDEKIHGLELGADDYLEKPYDPRELHARLNAQIRKKTPSTCKINDIIFNLSSKQITHYETHIILSQKENDLLFYLIENANTIFSAQQLIYAVYDHPDDVLPNTITATIRHIRKKLPSNIIKTIKTRGYLVEL